MGVGSSLMTAKSITYSIQYGNISCGYGRDVPFANAEKQFVPVLVIVIVLVPAVVAVSAGAGSALEVEYRESLR